MDRRSASGLDLQTAADELGVHYQTAYRWVRSGRLVASRIDGRYLVDRSDLDKVQAARSHPERTPAPGGVRLERSGHRLFAALVDGDEPTVRRTVRQLIDEGAPLLDVIEHVLVPPLRRIGEAWHDGELSVWEEHRASSIVERVLGDVTPNPRGRRRGTAVVVAIAGDRHSLPTTMAAVALRSDQWHVHHLGADLPVDDVVRCCTDHDVDLAVISVTNPALGDEPARAADRIRRTGTRVLIGGPARSLTDLLAAARFRDGTAGGGC